MVYGSFAYIGLMAAHPEVQGQGVGRRILDELLAWIGARNCPTILLDASPAGAPLYVSSGFVDDDLTLVFQREQLSSGAGLHTEIPIPSDADFSQLIAFDTPFFGANRSRLFNYYRNEIPERIVVSRDSTGKVDGYLVAQSRTIGPWVASDAGIAEELLSQALGLSFEGGPQVFVSGSNGDAVKLLGRFGFEEQRSLRHMYRGKSIRQARGTRIYGQATLGYG